MRQVSPMRPILVLVLGIVNMWWTTGVTFALLFLGAFGLMFPWFHRRQMKRWSMKMGLLCSMCGEAAPVLHDLTNAQSEHSVLICSSCKQTMDSLS